MKILKMKLLAISLLFSFQAEAIIIDNLRIRPAVSNGYLTSFYFDLTNSSDSLDYLLKVELVDHQESDFRISKTVIEKGIARVIKIDRLAIPSYTKVNLEPTGIYVVLNNLSPQFIEEKRAKIKFTFTYAGEIINEIPLIKTGQ